MSDPRQTNPEGSRTPSRRRRWLFRFLTVVLSLFPFLLLEVGLRVLGYGHDTRLIIPVAAGTASSQHQLNPAVDRAYFGPDDLPGPEPRPFALPKPPGVYRIVVVGGSTVAGFPYAFELALPRHLEIVLQQQSSERQFEVLNAGITAISSFSEVDIVRQAIHCDPDLIIVHSGHNEFYGVGGLGSTAAGFAPQLYPLFEMLRRGRSCQLGIRLAYGPVRTHLQESLPADVSIPLDGLLFRRVQDYYRSHLQEIVNLAAAANVPLLLTTIPGNLRDLSPMVSIPREDLTEQQRQRQTDREKTIARQISYREFAAALSTLTEAREWEPTSAILAYREAQCLEALQRTPEAAEAYVLAGDLDGCRFRAPSSFAGIVERVASAGAGKIFFCDVARRLREESTLPVPGNDFFLEHVHYNLEGHWRVALILGEFIQTRILGNRWRGDRVPEVESRDALLGVTAFDHLAADTFALMALRTWPLKLAPDNAAQVGLVKARIQGAYAALDSDDRETFANLSMVAMQRELLVAMGYASLNAGRADRALELFRLHMRRRPWDVSGYAGAAEAAP